jgi:hypothetical protein
MFQIGPLSNYIANRSKFFFFEVWFDTMFGMRLDIYQTLNIWSFMAKSDPTKDPEFKRVLSNLLNAPPRPHSEMKLGKSKQKKKKNPGGETVKRRV